MFDGYAGSVLIVAGLLMVIRPRWSIPAMLCPAKDETGVPWPVRTSTRIRLGGVFAIVVGLIFVLA